MHTFQNLRRTGRQQQGQRTRRPFSTHSSGRARMSSIRFPTRSSWFISKAVRREAHAGSACCSRSYTRVPHLDLCPYTPACACTGTFGVGLEGGRAPCMCSAFFGHGWCHASACAGAESEVQVAGVARGACQLSRRGRGVPGGVRDVRRLRGRTVPYTVQRPAQYK